jgi:S-formylglutathione hydrolase FrmB
MSLLIGFCKALLFVGMTIQVTFANESARTSPAERNDQGFLVHKVTSPLQSGPTEIRVLLPEQMEAGRRYTVLYVLPVEAGDKSRYGDGLAECEKHDIHNKHSIICVAPTFSDLPWYADHPSDPQIQQETYFLKVVIPLVDKTYPTIAKRNGRLLVGFSKSGWGAFTLLLRHPDKFGRAAAWDAPLMKRRPDQFGMGPIFGTQQNFEKYKMSQLLKRQASLLQDETRLVHFGYGNFRDHHERAEELLAELGIGRRYKDGPRRRHDWHSGWLPEAVGMLLQKK